eukprot:TRINITY_DN10408_c0_g2_i1.p1 TRINITY_DN10408_c0_g2~~TRINITY_DN10408_c0_g2_i1.p1  ORF type:complete len:236 (+),score=35.81 TRINITY_DN10408_c0_g2_i1:38-709(+)
MSDNAFIVSALLILATDPYLVAICRYSPWKTSMLYFADLLIMSAFRCTIHLGISFSNAQTFPHAEDTASVEWSILQAGVSAPTFVVAAGIIAVLVQGFIHFRADLRGELASQVVEKLESISKDLQNMIHAMKEDLDLQETMGENLAELSLYDLNDIFRGVRLIRRNILGQDLRHDSRQSVRVHPIQVKSVTREQELQDCGSADAEQRDKAAKGPTFAKIVWGA